MQETYLGNPGEGEGFDKKRIEQFQRASDVIERMREVQRIFLEIEKNWISTDPDRRGDEVDYMIEVLSHVQYMNGDRELRFHKDYEGITGSGDGKNTKRIEMNETWKEVMRLEDELNELRKQGYIS